MTQYMSVSHSHFLNFHQLWIWIRNNIWPSSCCRHRSWWGRGRLPPRRRRSNPRRPPAWSQSPPPSPCAQTSRRSPGEKLKLKGDSVFQKYILLIGAILNQAFWWIAWHWCRIPPFNYELWYYQAAPQSAGPGRGCGRVVGTERAPAASFSARPSWGAPPSHPPPRPPRGCTPGNISNVYLWICWWFTLALALR